MSKYLVSVCIPTYNRAECLSQCLETITLQFSDPQVRDAVEVVISDNASTDNTREIADGFRKKFPNIVYFQNAENIGYDRNALQVVDKAIGEYCWLLGDDDGLFEDALAAMLPKFREAKYPYFLANTWGYDNQLGKPALSAPNLSIREDVHFGTLGNFVQSISGYRQVVGYFGGMSGQIFLRKMWADLPGKEKFIGTNTIHLFVILQAFKNFPASYFPN